MGNGQSTTLNDQILNRKKQLNLQAQKLVGKRASLKQSILTASERAELVERSLGHNEAAMERRISRSQKSMKDKLLEVERERDNFGPQFEATDTSVCPELAGCVQGAEWNNFLKAVWSGEQRVVVHSVILPPGKNPKQVSLNNFKVIGSKKYTLPLGQMPNTMSNPSGTFEVLVEQDIVPAQHKVPPHFLVVKGCESSAPWEGATQSTGKQIDPPQQQDHTESQSPAPINIKSPQQAPVEA